MEYILHNLVLIRNFTQELNQSLFLMCVLQFSGQTLAQWAPPINAVLLPRLTFKVSKYKAKHKVYIFPQPNLLGTSKKTLLFTPVNQQKMFQGSERTLEAKLDILVLLFWKEFQWRRYFSGVFLLWIGTKTWNIICVCVCVCAYFKFWKITVCQESK